MQCPVFMRVYNPGTVTTAVQLKIGAVGVTLGDCQTNKPWPHVMAGAGQGGYNPQTGMTMVGTSNWANAAAPVATALSAATAEYAATVLGGQFAFALQGSAETDFVVFAYLLPAATSLIPGKNFYITDVNINSYISVVSVTTATVLQWGLCTGATQITLATVSDSAGVKATRRIPLGIQTYAIGAVVGTKAPTISQTFTTPVFCENGNYIHIIVKMPLSTATGNIRGTILINGYFE